MCYSLVLSVIKAIVLKGLGQFALLLLNCDWLQGFLLFQCEEVDFWIDFETSARLLGYTSVFMLKHLGGTNTSRREGRNFFRLLNPVFVVVGVVVVSRGMVEFVLDAVTAVLIAKRPFCEETWWLLPWLRPG